MLCERTECATECLYQTPVIETLLAPVLALLNGQQVKHTLTHVCFNTAVGWIDHQKVDKLHLKQIKQGVLLPYII